MACVFDRGAGCGGLGVVLGMPQSSPTMCRGAAVYFHHVLPILAYWCVCVCVCVYVCGCVAVLCVSLAWAVVLLTCPRYVVRDTLYAALIRAATALGPPDSSGHASPVFASPMIPIAVGHAILAALFIFCAAAGSGGHIVNTITLATAITGHTAWVRCFLYLIVQTLGSIVGTVAVRAMIGWDSATYVGLGGCELGSLSVGGAFLSEFFCTFSLLLVGAWPCAVQCVAG